MESTKKIFTDLLCLTEDWSVDNVELLPLDKRVEINVSYTGKKVVCPECGESCSIGDHARERHWRHLDTMQFATHIKSRVPRSNCKVCGVKTIKVPWAEKHSRFTLLFEEFTIKVIESCTTLKSAQELTGINWDTLNSIMKRAVERGLSRRSLEKVHNIGIDEKQFRKGHNYISSLNDLDKGRVLDVVEGRDGKASEELIKKIPVKQRTEIKAVATDLWKAYIKACKEIIPQADIVHDKFHISKYLNESVDKVRKSENHKLKKEGKDALIGTKYLWLINPENMDKDIWVKFCELKSGTLKTARAWALKENFRYMWDYRYRKCAEDFFDSWYSWAIRSRLKPIKKVAKRLKKHLENILTYFKHGITNAVSEGLNSRIQTVKAAARGFHSFENFRIRILFFCGKLDLYPKITH